MTKIERTPGWRGRLVKVIGNHRRQPFEWGKHDCGIFAADCVLAMTGIDFAEPYRGKYDTEEGSARALRRVGKSTHVHIVEENFEEISPVMATTGDIGLVDVGLPVMSLGIINGEVVAVYGLKGIGFIPTDKIVRAFKVG